MLDYRGLCADAATSGWDFWGVQPTKIAHHENRRQDDNANVGLSARLLGLQYRKEI
jgi:hypothetical protein